MMGKATALPVNGFFLGATALAIWLNGQRRLDAASIVFCTAILATTLATVGAQGLGAGVHHVLIPATLVPYLVFDGRRWVSAIGLSTGTLAAYMGLLFLDHSLHNITTATLVGLCASACAVFLIGLVVHQLQISWEQREMELYLRSERLLLNIIPEKIRDRLNESGQQVVDEHPQVTVVFSDMVGFTRLARELGAEPLIDVLNRIFTGFDMLAEAFGAEKIKTIGDCYMAVTGVPTEDPDHVFAAARFAIAMIEEQAPLTEELDVPIKLRIGLHTGPAMAGVIGFHKFTYDVWGETVNLASRLQTHADEGEILVSRAVRDALGDEFIFGTPRIVEMKGYGDVEVHSLIAEIDEDVRDTRREARVQAEGVTDPGIRLVPESDGSEIA
jgi:class 3 adenylate cyclase